MGPMKKRQIYAGRKWMEQRGRESIWFEKEGRDRKVNSAIS